MVERAEIVSGLKNAIERGYSLEIGIQSFINAGYNRQDVYDSARVLGGAVLKAEVPPEQPASNLSSSAYQSSQPSYPQTIEKEQSALGPPMPIQPQPKSEQPVLQQFPQPIPITRPAQLTSGKEKNRNIVIGVLLLLLFLISILLSTLFSSSLMKLLNL